MADLSDAEAGQTSADRTDALSSAPVYEKVLDGLDVEDATKETDCATDGMHTIDIVLRSRSRGEDSDCRGFEVPSGFEHGDERVAGVASAGPRCIIALLREIQRGLHG